MAEALVLEFEGIGKAEYEAVNANLGFDPATGSGEWPEGLIVHSAGTSDNGAFTVIEVWSSREAQGAFMEASLGAALAAGGVTAMPKVNWISLIALHVPGD